MPVAFKTIALIGRYKSRDVAAPLSSLGRFLEKQGCRVLIDEQTALGSGVRAFRVAKFEEIGARADLVVVLGGDGSMLSTARALAPQRVPLVGINQGRLGFTTDIALSSMRTSMRAILAGDFKTERRTMLYGTVDRRRKSAASAAGGAIAMNDIVVSKGATGRLIEILVHIDGEFVYDLRADGLIAATPTGSTAYSLSSNGPILHPAVGGVVLVPISPHTLSNRPIAISDRATIEITLKRGADAKLHFDGQTQIDLREGDCVRICRARHVATFIHPPGYDYFAMLREKLHWSENLL